MKKISLLFIAFIFIILSCSKEQNAVVVEDLNSPKSEMYARLEARKSSYVRGDASKITPREVKALINNNKELVALLLSNGISIDDIFGPKLLERNSCWGDCYAYVIFADPNNDGVTTIDEIEIVEQYILKLVTRSQVIAAGYPYIDDVAWLDCLGCDGAQDCNKLTVADLVTMLHMMSNPYGIPCVI